MSVVKRRDNAPEMLLRRQLHALGLRYRVQIQVPGSSRRSIDVAFTRARLAVFVDGCFWHACPAHGAKPKNNRDWWRWKFETNTARDRDTDRLLSAAGWHVMRIWEHEDPKEAASKVAATLILIRQDQSPTEHPQASRIPQAVPAAQTRDD